MNKVVTELPYKLEDTYILQFGTFYFYESFIVSEIQEGVSFDILMAKMLIELIDAHYGKDAYIGYISNRIHKYAIANRAWFKFFEMRYRLKAYAIVSSKKPISLVCMIKKLIYRTNKCNYDSLLEAASWLTSIHVLNKNKTDLHKKFEISSNFKNKNHFL